MDKTTQGWINGFLGVLLFSGSQPATRLAVMEFSPLFITVARATIAGLLAVCLLLLFRQKWPKTSDLISLLAVAMGVVVGFPLLSALALQDMTAARSIVFMGLLPIVTAIFGVLRGGEKLRPAFWFCSLAGAALIIAFAFQKDAQSTITADALMFGAIFVGGFAYAEGAVLSRRMGGWQVICWALVLALPVMGTLVVTNAPHSVGAFSLSAWAGLLYVSLFSMLLGFIFWYRGLAMGGIAAVGQLQLLQPFLALTLAAALLHETIHPAMLVVTVAVVLCVAGAKRFAT